MAARGPRLLNKPITLILILHCAVTSIVCQEMMIMTQHRKTIRIKRAANNPTPRAVSGDYGETTNQFASSLWSLLQTMDTFDTKPFDSGPEQVVGGSNSTRIVHAAATVDRQTTVKEVTVQAPPTTKNKTNRSEVEKRTQGLQRGSPPIVQLLTPSDLPPTSAVPNLQTTHNPNFLSTNISISNTKIQQNKINQYYNGSGEVADARHKDYDALDEQLSTVAVTSLDGTKSHEQSFTTISPSFMLNFSSSGASTKPFTDDSRKVDEIHFADAEIEQEHQHSRRKTPRFHQSYPHHHHYKPNVEPTTQPSRNIMYVVIMQDRPCDGICCRRESYSGKCRLSMRCAVMNFHRTDMRKLTCGTSYHSLHVPVHPKPPQKPSITRTLAFPAITPRSTAGPDPRNASIDAYDTKEPVETSVRSTPVGGIENKQDRGGLDDPEVDAGNSRTPTPGDDDMKQTPVGANKVRTHVSSNDGSGTSGNTEVDDSASSEVNEADSWMTHSSPSRRTIDADVQRTANYPGNGLHTTVATPKNNDGEPSLDKVTNTASMNQSGSMDYENLTGHQPGIITTVDVATTDMTNETLDVFESNEDFGKTLGDEEADDGFFEFYDGEYFGTETDDSSLSNETWAHSHNKTEDDTEFGEFDAYVTDEQSDIDYNDDDYTRDPDYRDDYHYYTDYVERGVDQGDEASNGSPRHLVYTDQVWYGGTDFALGPRELSEVEAVQLNSPNNWHRFGDDGDAEWLNEEDQRQPHLVLSSLGDRQPAERI